MADIIQIGIVTASLGVTLVFGYILTHLLPEEIRFPENLTGPANFYKLLICLIVFALFDFYFVSFIPVVGRLHDPLLQYIMMGIFLMLSISVIFITIEVRKVILNIEISLISRNLQFLKHSIRLILMQEIIVVFFYILGLASLILSLDTLPGIAFIFDVQETEITDLNLISDSLSLILNLILAGIKGAFLILHHGSIIVVFITLYVILEEWSQRARETTIYYFRIFTLGFIIQGMGQIIQTSGIIYAPFLLTSEGELPSFVSLPIFLGSLLGLIGAVIYFISFMMAAISLLNNISHMLVPPLLITLYKIAVLIFPIIYGFLYGFLFLLNLFWFFGFQNNTVTSFATMLETLIHFIDIPAMILLPYSCGLFFLVAYRQSKEEKKGVQLSTYVLWIFLSLFLIFSTGNNTMSMITWFGMLHAPLALLGSLALLFGLSRVADHASRYRRVIKYIRETPDDFLFLAKLGEAERKIQALAKIDSLVTTGVIHPLVPIQSPTDETKLILEINSYMEEISKQFKRRHKLISDELIPA